MRLTPTIKPSAQFAVPGHPLMSAAAKTRSTIPLITIRSLMHSMVTSAGGKALTTLVVVSIGPLSQDHARYAPSPQLLDRCQDVQLVVCKNVLISRVAPARRSQRPCVF